MARSPQPLPPDALGRRRRTILALAREVGFVGAVEYRHAYSQTGGSQYLSGAGSKADLLTVYAEAFDRDADPEDFSLRAIVAHERGHQLIARHERIAKWGAGLSTVVEEVLASVLGALILPPGTDRDSLVAKATADLLTAGTKPDDAVRMIENLWDTLGGLL